MNRPEMLARAESADQLWDIIVVGGGATGLGTAVDASSRGYRTLLLEQDDLAKGTSSRSTKLIHGGVRYLQQGNVGLVLEALRERGLLTQNAPHLVTHLGFVVPNYTWWEAPFYGVGLKIYDLLAGRLGLGPSKHLSRAQTLEKLPTLEPEGLKGGTIYYDGQFDDARLAVCLAQTAANHGAALVNYMKVVSLLKSNGLIKGVVAVDLESGREITCKARVVVNATGVFTDGLRKLDEPGAASVIAPSQGVHIVLDRSFLPGRNAIMVPKTDDGRVLFAIPWHGRALIGTTDTAVEAPALEPQPLPQEIEFLLTHAARYLTKDPKPADVRSAFAGLRPLVKTADQKETALVPRDHTILVSASGLVTVTGGKWTTYRKMAQDTVDEATTVGGLEPRPCVTPTLRLHGAAPASATLDTGSVYGTDREAIDELVKQTPAWKKKLHRDLPYRLVEVVWAVRKEMARTVEDVLSRRLRALPLDARASMEAAPLVASIMAAELPQGKEWEQAQCQKFNALAKGYLVA